MARGREPSSETLPPSVPPPPPGWRWIPAEKVYAWWDGSQFRTRARRVGDRWEYETGTPERWTLVAPMVGPPASPRRRRRWLWVLGAVGLVALGVAVAFLGQLPLFDTKMGPMTVDLRQVRGNFPTSDSGYAVTSYQRDGFHLLIRDPSQDMAAGTRAVSSVPRLSVEVAAVAIRTPLGASFGPYCRQSGEREYEFLSALGDQMLVQVDESAAAPERVTTLAHTTGTGLTPGVSERLMITCSVSSSGAVELGGYVNGHETIAATATRPVAGFRSTGFVGRTGSAAPAEWRVTKFWRHLPDTMPKNAP